MAYDVIYSEGCDNIGTSNESARVRFRFLHDSAFVSINPLATSGPFGTSCLRFNVTGAQDQWMWHTIVGASETTAFLSAWVWLDNGESEQFSLIEGPFVFGTEHVTCVIDNDNLGWTVRRGGAGGTSIGTGVGSTPNNTWFHLEIRAVISATVGEVQVRTNGTQVVNITGANTFSTGGGRTGVIDGYMIRGNGISGDELRIDDIVMQGASGDWLGRHKITSYLANASSTETDWNSVSASSNHANVDDTSPDNDTTYNWSDTVGQRDRYGIETPDFPNTAVAVSARALVSMEDPGSALIKVGIRSEGGIEDLSTALLVPRLGSYQPVDHIVHSNPDSTEPWSATDLDGVELVVETA